MRIAVRPANQGLWHWEGELIMLCAEGEGGLMSGLVCEVARGMNAHLQIAAQPMVKVVQMISLNLA